MSCSLDLLLLVLVVVSGGEHMLFSITATGTVYFLIEIFFSWCLDDTIIEILYDGFFLLLPWNKGETEDHSRVHDTVNSAFKFTNTRNQYIQTYEAATLMISFM